MTQVISVMSRHQFRQDDPSPLGAPRQLAPSYDRVRWLTALVEEFGPTFVASFHFTPYGKWVYETWVVANPRDGESSLVGPRSTAPTHARRRLKCTCVDCGDDFLTSKADTKRCPPCQIERKKYLQREWHRRRRGSYQRCEKCNADYVQPPGPRTGRCDDCTPLALKVQRKAKRDWRRRKAAERSA